MNSFNVCELCKKTIDLETNNTFKKVATYQYTSEAIIFKGKLESEGIKVYKRDNYTVDTDPMVSNAIGGVKLFVAEKDFDKATNILESISKYALDNEGEAISCPTCNSSEVRMYSVVDDAKSFLSMLVAMFFVILPIYTKYSYKCESCKHKFNID